jgi:hypothetical protein
MHYCGEGLPSFDYKFFRTYKSSQAVQRPFEQLTYNTTSGVFFNAIIRQLNQFLPKLCATRNSAADNGTMPLSSFGTMLYLRGRLSKQRFLTRLLCTVGAW